MLKITPPIKKKQEVVSQEAAYCLIRSQLHYTFEEIDNLPFTLYRTLFEQADNQMTAHRGGEFSYQNKKDRDKILSDEIDAFKSWSKAKVKGK